MFEADRHRMQFNFCRPLSMRRSFRIVGPTVRQSDGSKKWDEQEINSVTPIFPTYGAQVCLHRCLDGKQSDNRTL